MINLPLPSNDVVKKNTPKANAYEPINAQAQKRVSSFSTAYYRGNAWQYANLIPVILALDEISLKQGMRTKAQNHTVSAK